MPIGPAIRKFTCLVRDVEVRGRVRDFTNASSFNIEVDPNYRNLLAFSRWDKLHCEQYGTANDGGCSANPQCPPPPSTICDMAVPKVFVGGQLREIENGMHVRFRGDWIADHGHAGGFWAGLIKIDYAHAEFHPYDKNSFATVEETIPGGMVGESHAVCAPLHTQKFGDTPWNDAWGYSKHVPTESIQEEVSAEWHIPAAPPEAGVIPGQTHKLVYTESVRESAPAHFFSRRISIDGNVLKVKITIKGTDVNNTNKFHADYAIFWEPLPPPLRKLRTRIEPAVPPAGQSQVTVFAEDADTQASVPAARVYLNNRDVGPVGAAFMFNNQCKARVTQPDCPPPPRCRPRDPNCDPTPPECPDPVVSWTCSSITVKALGYEDSDVFSASPPPGF